jgi:hypothetical protein
MPQLPVGCAMVCARDRCDGGGVPGTRVVGLATQASRRVSLANPSHGKSVWRREGWGKGAGSDRTWRDRRGWGVCPAMAPHATRNSCDLGGSKRCVMPRGSGTRVTLVCPPSLITLSTVVTPSTQSALAT